MGTKFMTLRPIGKNILVKYEQASDRTAGGILISEDARGKSSYARVEAVGTHPEIEVSVGERVYVSNFGGTEIAIEGAEYRMVTMNELLAVMNRPDGSASAQQWNQEVENSRSRRSMLYGNWPGVQEE